MSQNTKKVLILIAAIVGSLFLAEVVVRMSGYQVLHAYRSRLGRRVIEEPAFALPYLYEPHGSFSEHWPSNPRGYFDEVSSGVFYRINSAGFRGEDWEAPSEDRIRIAVLGDSVCFGNGVHDRHHFATLLEGRLNKSEYLGSPVEVLNFGLGNFDTIGEAALLRHRVLDYEPDVCVILYYPNDLRDIGGRSGTALMKPVRTMGALRDRFHTADAILRLMDARAQQERYVEEIAEAHRVGSSGVPMFRAALKDIAAVCGERGILPVLAIHPVLMDLDESYPFRDAHDFVVAEATAAGIEAFDLLPAFDGEDAPALWVHPLDPHPNEKGHRITGNALFDCFRELVRGGTFKGG